MSNKIYEDSIYNKEIKLKFLSQFKDDSPYKRVFYNSYKFESSFKKDLYAFSLEEIEKLCFKLDPLTLSAAKAIIAYINSYIKWAIENKLTSQITSPIDQANYKTADIKKFIPYVELYFSKEELDDIINVCVNYQDKALIALLFWGATVDQVCLLKKEDIYYDLNELKLTTEVGEVRILPVEQEYMELIYKAAYENEYLPNNGEANTTGRNKFELLDTVYVFRPAKTRTTKPTPMNYHALNRRLKIIGTLIDNPYFTSKNIYRSGMVYQAYLLWKPDGVFGKEQIIEICDKYGLKKVKQGNYENYNWVPMQDYLNLEQIKKLYPLEIT